MENAIGGYIKGDFDRSLEMLKREYDRVSSQNKLLRERIEGWNKDEEIQKARAYAAEVRDASLYQMTKTQTKEHAAFVDAHWKKCKNRGKFLYDIEYCGIGSTLSIKCPICGEEKDITDFSSW